MRETEIVTGIMFLLLLVLWIVFNGNLTLEILLFGVVLSGAVCLFASRFLGYSFKTEIKRIKILPDFAAYIAVLIWEIIKANISVLKYIHKGNGKIDPVIVHFTSDLESDLSRTVLANSITLTPGTITVSLKGREFYVHCLDRSMADGIDTSVFVKRLRRMEEKIHG